MKSKRKWPWYLLLIIIILAAVVVFFPYPSLNNYQKKGRLILTGLKDTVEVLRDEKGMAYIYARNLPDAIMAQGFVMAQDRLFQMNLSRLFSSGRISELVGKPGKEIDIRMRTIGFRRHAEKHGTILSPETRLFLQKYADGVNAYINTHKDTHHLAFKLAGITPDPWTIEDTLTIMYYMGWDSAGNLQAEIISQMLVDKLGLEKAGEIFPILNNPDDMNRAKTKTGTRGTEPILLNLARDNQIRNYLETGPLRVGSNNWVLGPKLSKSGKPIVANDPHLDSRMLPGPWYPCGILLPDLRVVGVIIPGIPGMVVGRTSHHAIGITNAYGDAQDLFVETLDPEDPNRYMEGEKSLPFKVIEETVKIKNKNAPGEKSQSDNWRYQQDTMNVLARRITPIMIEALMPHEDTRELGRILAAWDV